MRAKYIFTIAILSICAIFVFGKTIVQANNAMAGHDSDRQMYGFAWSSNIGWISFNNCTDVTTCPGTSYGVSINPTSGNLSGYAWSSNVGWISFNIGEFTSNDLAVCGTKCQPNMSSTGKFSGWAKTISGSDGSSGWNGLIALSSDSDGDSNSWGFNANLATGIVTGYAWGGNVVGWISASSCSTSDCSGANDYHVSIMPAISTLTTPDCTIPAGASSCSTTVTWNTTDPVGAYSLTSNYHKADSSSYYKPDGSSGLQAFTISFGSETFHLSQNINGIDSIDVATSTANATCQSGSTWNGTICASSYPYVSLFANPTNVPKNGTSNLTWTSNLDSSYSCVPGSGLWQNPTKSEPANLAYPPGENTKPITENTTFTIQCTKGGTTIVSNSVVVSVITPQPPTVTLTATPPSFNSAGGTSTLSWLSPNATSCSAPTWTSNTAPNSNAQVSLPPATDSIGYTNSYTMTCSNTYGSGSDTVTITVGPQICPNGLHGIDNNGDGKIDCGDDSCHTDNDHTNPATCKKVVKPIFKEF
ncbi:MAG TPA: hypothetical protein VMR49_02235 [Candidatus Paceibacterota bacterium]|nr:hypothetical protein [Candidatus Paceibacterota bacterium]